MEGINIKKTILVLLFYPLLSTCKYNLDNEVLATQETVHYLLNLTEIIENCLENPTQDEGNLLLKSLYEYYNNLDDIYWMVKSEDEKEKNLALSYLRDVVDHGIPVHMTMKINFDYLKAKFEWNDRSVQELYDVIKASKALWENVEFLYNEFTFNDLDFITNLPPDC